MSGSEIIVLRRCNTFLAKFTKTNSKWLQLFFQCISKDKRKAWIRTKFQSVGLELHDYLPSRALFKLKIWYLGGTLFRVQSGVCVYAHMQEEHTWLTWSCVQPGATVHIVTRVLDKLRPLPKGANCRRCIKMNWYPQMWWRWWSHSNHPLIGVPYD